MEYIIIGAILLLVVLNIILIIIVSKKSSAGGMSQGDKRDLKDAFSDNIEFIAESLERSGEKSSYILSERLKNMNEKINTNNGIIAERLGAMEKSQTERLMLIEKNQGERLSETNKRLSENIDVLNTRLETLEKSQGEKLEYIRGTLERNILSMQEGNEKKLNEIKNAVDEKLAKTLNDRFTESFKILTDELEKVTTTIGEMKKISSEVGTLSKMLSGVKTAGIFGEIQLGAIIEQILAPEQYVKNVVTNKASRDPVEFAVKMPGGTSGEVLMPIDSKFPYTLYSDMQTLYENNDFQGFEEKKKQLIHTVRGMAKDIKDSNVTLDPNKGFNVVFLQNFILIYIFDILFVLKGHCK